MKKPFLLIAFLCSITSLSFGQAPPAPIRSSPSVTVKMDRILAINTNFVLPVMRFDLLKTSYQDNSFGSLSLFNSIGAGISLNFGEQMEISENGSSNGNLDEKFANMLGLQLGFIFSADLQEGESSLHFAPTAALLILDFQIGFGYELGLVNQENSRTLSLWDMEYLFKNSRRREHGGLNPTALNQEKAQNFSDLLTSTSHYPNALSSRASFSSPSFSEVRLRGRFPFDSLDKSAQT